MNKDIEMPQHVVRQKESGMSVWTYCQHNGIGYHSMQYWIKKLRRLDCKSVTPAKDLFIELAPSQKETFSIQGSSLGNPRPLTTQVELTFPNGLILKIFG
jgi:hypothetical protein